MNYDSIILELLERVQNLEKEVKELKEGTSVKPIENMTGKTNTQLAREYIQQQKEEARTKGEGSIVLVAGDIQKAGLILFNLVKTFLELRYMLLPL